MGGSVARHRIVGESYAFHIHVLIFKFLAMIGSTVFSHGYTGNFPDYFISAKTNQFKKQTMFFITASQF